MLVTKVNLLILFIFSYTFCAQNNEGSYDKHTYIKRYSDDTPELQLFSYFSKDDKDAILKPYNTKADVSGIITFIPYSSRAITLLYRRYLYCSHLGIDGKFKTFMEGNQRMYYETVGRADQKNKTYIKRHFRNDPKIKALHYYSEKNIERTNNNRISFYALKPNVTICEPLTKGYLYLPSLLDVNTSRMKSDSVATWTLTVLSLPLPWIKAIPALAYTKKAMDVSKLNPVQNAIHKLLGIKVFTKMTPINALERGVLNVVGVNVLMDNTSVYTGLTSRVLENYEHRHSTHRMNDFTVDENIQEIRKTILVSHKSTLFYKPTKISTRVCKLCYKLKAVHYKPYRTAKYHIHQPDVFLPGAWVSEQYKRPKVGARVDWFETILRIPFHPIVPGRLPYVINFFGPTHNPVEEKETSPLPIYSLEPILGGRVNPLFFLTLKEIAKYIHTETKKNKRPYMDLRIRSEEFDNSWWDEIINQDPEHCKEDFDKQPLTTLQAAKNKLPPK